MNGNIQDPQLLLIFSVLIPLISGMIVLAFGRKLPSQGSWVVWTGVLLAIVGAVFGGAALIKDGIGQGKLWLVGWIWPKEEANSITVGVIEDFLAVSMILLVGVISISFLSNTALFDNESRREKVLSSLGISVAGVAISWMSATPWFAFVGIGLSILGGFLSFGSRWENRGEADLASRFVWQRAGALTLSLVGATMIASGNTPLSIDQVKHWSGGSVLGTWLFALGLFFQFQPFPLLGWLMSESGVQSTVKNLFTQLFPAFATFAVFVRMEPLFKAAEVFPVFGWIALGSSLLALVSGLVQEQWRNSLGAWISGGLSMSLAILAFTGPFAAESVFLGVILASTSFAFLGGAFESGQLSDSSSGNQNKNKNQKIFWGAGASYLAGAIGTGLLGSVTASGGLRWVSSAWDEPIYSAVFVFIFFLFFLLGWKLSHIIAGLRASSGLGWVSVILPYLFVILGLGVLWTGSFSGATILADRETVFPSVLNIFFGEGAAKSLDEGSFISYSALYWGIYSFAFLIAYWMSGGKKDKWSGVRSGFPRAANFVEKGYGTQYLFRQLASATTWLGRQAQSLVDQVIWDEWLPVLLKNGIRRSSKGALVTNDFVFTKAEAKIREWLDVPSKVLQLVQNGDVQWYLFFGVGCGIAILIHYLLVTT